MVIRFTAAEILYLGFFSNFILLTAFVGLGMGFLLSNTKLELKSYFPFALVFLFSLVLISNFDADILRSQKGLFFYGFDSKEGGLPAVVLLPILFVTTAFMFAALGQQTGRLFKYFSPLKAYTLDIIGSLFGILLFSVQSYAWSPPFIWVITTCFLLGIAYLFIFDPEGIRNAVFIFVAGVCVVVLMLSGEIPYKTIWSVYQKIEYADDPSLFFINTDIHSRIYVNGIVHQFLHPSWKADKYHYGVACQRHLEGGGET